MRLHTATADELPPLGWQHAQPFNLTRVEPIRPGMMKPSGGLWTSPLRPDGTGRLVSGWIRWCEDNSFAAPAAPVTLIIPDPSARIAVVDSHADLLGLETAYRDHDEALLNVSPRVWPLVDWVAMSREVDAVWLTDDGQWATRFTQPGLYGWDCETVLWLNPRFRVGGRLQSAQVAS